MPSDFLTPFLELDEEFCKNFRGLEATDGSGPHSQQQQQQQQQQHTLRVLGFRRRHSLCPVTLPNSKFNGGSSESNDSSCCWGLDSTSSIHPEQQQQQQQWNQEGRLPRSSLSHIPFRVDRSVSMIEGSLGRQESSLSPPLLVSPPPGLGSPSSVSPSPTSGCSSSPPHISTRYKTELCRTYEESGTCKYGAKCQFAHGVDELRGLNRHPKYKTEPCRTFHTIGFCPYGARCHFIHNADEISGGSPTTTSVAPAAQKQQKLRPPLLRHSLSFAGFSSAGRSFPPLEESQQGTPPSSLLFARASSVSSSPPSTGSPELLSPLFPEPCALKHYPYPFSGIPDLAGDDLALHFRAVTDSARCLASKGANLTSSLLPPPPPLVLTTTTTTVNPPPGLQRCSSADSLSEEGYTSSCSLSSSSSGGAESPSFEGRRLPIFSRLSVSDE
ncbi:mRNA decay activator protein ZFP36 [Nelusetta ayraudi]|uniref:mRNA decay activator protein ZFP36 n=1 Tax=Nelusetta ayraudi TaxID=303726 RepID=UPI003F70C606